MRRENASRTLYTHSLAKVPGFFLFSRGADAAITPAVEAAGSGARQTMKPFGCRCCVATRVPGRLVRDPAGPSTP
jgi:hypothetical protein